MNELVKKENNLMPVSIDDKLNMAGHLCKSGLMPNGLKTREQVFVALQYGHELGLSPMVSIQSIYVVNNRPTLSTDLMKALVFKNKMAESYEEIELFDEKDNKKIIGYEVKVQRNDLSTIFNGKFTFRDAQIANLVNKDNWKKYPERMMLHRATSICLRKAFPELFAGLYTQEELIDGDNFQNESSLSNETESKLRVVSQEINQEENKIDPLKKMNEKLEEVEKEKKEYFVYDTSGKERDIKTFINFSDEADFISQLKEKFNIFIAREYILLKARPYGEKLTTGELDYLKRIRAEQNKSAEYNYENFLIELEYVNTIIKNLENIKKLNEAKTPQAVSEEDKDSKDIDFGEIEGEEKDDEVKENNEKPHPRGVL